MVELEKAQQRWLQTEYPVEIARRCIDTFRKTSKRTRKAFDQDIHKHLAEGTFQRHVYIRDLWVPEKSLTKEWSTTKPLEPIGGPRRRVLCGLPFMELIDKEASKGFFGANPVETLYRLFILCVPKAREVFKDHNSPLKLLHVNDYVMEKAFVYGIVLLSKYLGRDLFCYGIFGKWPPPFPANLVPRSPAPPPVDVEASNGEVNVPPHLRHGAPAASSAGY